MDSRHLIDPELVALLSMFPPADMTAEALPAMRERVQQLLATMAGADLPGVSRAERFVPAMTGDRQVRVLIYTSGSVDRSRPALLHIHGGAYVIGAPEMSEAANAALARELGCVVASVDYRLAPEHPYPAGLDDCYSALRWLHDEATVLGIDTHRLAVIGESAGGGLAAALALMARDRGEIALCQQVLWAPMLDDRTSAHEAPHPYAGEFVFNNRSNHFGWASLLGQSPGRSDVSPYAAPARAPNLAGLPPALILTGALDLFVEENLEYARRLMRAGVPTELHVYAGAPHGYQAMPASRAARHSTHETIDALRRAFATSGGPGRAAP